MTGIFSKFAISAIVAGGAGGMAVGIPLSSSASKQTHLDRSIVTTAPSLHTPQEEVKSPLPEIKVPDLVEGSSSVSAPSVEVQSTLSESSVSGPSNSNPEQSIQASQSEVVETVEASGLPDSSHLEETSESHSDTQASGGLEQKSLEDSRPSEEEEEETLLNEPEGNCTVFSATQETLKRFSGSSYVSVYCENKLDDDSPLAQWKGFFPTSFLNGGLEKFKEGAKFKIDVQEIEDGLGVGPAEEDGDSEAYETVFTSSHFSKNPLTGRWGGDPLSDSEDEEDDNDDPIYAVNLSKSGISDKFYIWSKYLSE